MVLGSAAVNALAFSGSNYLFNSMSSDDKKRHDLALEQLQKAEEEYNKRRIAGIDYQNQRQDLQRHAQTEFGQSMVAIQAYNEFTRPPVLSDFYKPSPKQKAYELVWITAGTVGVYFLAKKYF